MFCFNKYIFCCFTFLLTLSKLCKELFTNYSFSISEISLNKLSSLYPGRQNPTFSLLLIMLLTNFTIFVLILYFQDEVKLDGVATVNSFSFWQLM
jgi:hypothetical protein